MVGLLLSTFILLCDTAFLIAPCSLFLLAMYPRPVKVFLFWLIHGVLDFVIMLYVSGGKSWELQKFRTEAIRGQVYHLEQAVLSSISGGLVNKSGEVILSDASGTSVRCGVLIEGDVESCADHHVDDYGMVVVQGRKLGRALHLEDINHEEESILIQSLQDYITKELIPISRKIEEADMDLDKKRDLVRQAHQHYENALRRLDLVHGLFKITSNVTQEGLDDCIRGVCKLNETLIQASDTTMPPSRWPRVSQAQNSEAAAIRGQRDRS